MLHLRYFGLADVVNILISTSPKYVVRQTENEKQKPAGNAPLFTVLVAPPFYICLCLPTCYILHETIEYKATTTSVAGIEVRTEQTRKENCSLFMAPSWSE